MSFWGANVNHSIWGGGGETQLANLALSHIICQNILQTYILVYITSSGGSVDNSACDKMETSFIIGRRSEAISLIGSVTKPTWPGSRTIESHEYLSRRQLRRPVPSSYIWATSEWASNHSLTQRHIGVTYVFLCQFVSSEPHQISLRSSYTAGKYVRYRRVYNQLLQHDTRFILGRESRVLSITWHVYHIILENRENLQFYFKLVCVCSFPF